MSCHISFRSVIFTDHAGYVTVVVITDVPSHLHVRVTSAEPRIHKETVTKRGLAFKTDVRFCFTLFDDLEQNEPGDTLTHTFTLPGWTFCQTKWIYFWGTVAGEICVSTSPIFKHHNAFVVPLHTHQYSIYLPDGFTVNLWTLIGTNPDYGLQKCPLYHLECQFTDECHWLLVPTRFITTQMLTSGPAPYGAGHTHALKRLSALTFTPKVYIYESRTTICPAGHANCGAGYVATEVPQGIATSVGQTETVTDPEIDGDPNGEHWHFLKSLSDYQTLQGRITSVYACPLGHPLCRSDEVLSKVYFFRHYDEWFYTGRDQ